jgi:hypothetical protein
MPNRVIKSNVRTSSLQLADCLGSIFAAELLAPSREMMLISPWISNVVLLTNSFGQFRALMPEIGKTELALAELLSTLSERGTHICIIYRPNHPQTTDFLRRLPSAIERRASETLHEKGLITDHFYLRGSMNFTHSGVNLNDESVELTTDPHDVAYAMAEARKHWELLQA